MKKIYLGALSVLAGLTAMSQVSVTFQVDMNGQTVSPNGVHVAGNWQAAAGFAADWQPGTAQMSDDNTDGIYSLTVDVPPGQYEFKHINDNDWPGVEGVPVISQKGGGNDNRVFVVTQWHADNGGLVLPAIAFGGSAPEGTVAVRLQSDLANQEEISADGVHVAGTLITPNWTPEYGAMFSVSGTRYAYLAMVEPNSSYEYKFLNGNFFDGSEEWALGGGPIECSNGNNRTLDVGNEDVSTIFFCFNTCDPCAPQTEVTFALDLNGEGGGNPDGVSVAGSFQGWTPGATLLTDDDADGIYTATILVDQGTYEYKFINGIEWGDDESVPAACNVGGNRQLVVGADPVSVEVCFNQCTAECIPDPDPANITFRVNMNGEEVAAQGVWLMGDFTSPAWQGGAIQLTDDDSDGIYETTYEVSGPAEFQYKYANGDPNTTEENGDFAAGGCGVGNGLGGFNRVHVRSGEDEVLTAFVYNSCSDLVSTSNIELGQVNIFPNPTDGLTYIEIENPNRHNLRLNIVDVTGKVVRENVLVNDSRVEINAAQLAPGLYLLNVTNEKSERAVYKLMVR